MGAFTRALTRDGGLRSREAAGQRDFNAHESDVIDISRFSSWMVRMSFR